MPSFNIQYKDADDCIIKKETIMMRTLTGAKTSTAAFAPSMTEKIVVLNNLGLTVATKQNGKWSNES